MIPYCLPIKHDNWMEEVDSSSRRRVQNRKVKGSHCTVVKSQQESNLEQVTLTSTSSRKGSQNSALIRSEYVKSASGTGSPCFIYYQPAKGLLSKKQAQKEQQKSPPATRNSTKAAKDQLSFDALLSSSISALTSPSNIPLYLEESIPSCELMPEEHFLSTVDNVERYPYWGTTEAEVGNSKPSLAYSSSHNSQIYSLEGDRSSNTNAIIRKATPDSLLTDDATTDKQHRQRTTGTTYNPNQYNDACGRTTLHLAAEQGNVTIIELLLEAGINIDTTDENGQTALHIALMEEHDISVKLLLDKGANCNLRDYNYRTALHLAAQEGNVDIVRLLFDYGVEVDSKDLSGRTALHRAIEEGHEDVVRLMLHRGADAKIKVDNRSLGDKY